MGDGNFGGAKGTELNQLLSHGCLVRHMQATPHMDTDVTKVKGRLRDMGLSLRTLTRNTKGGCCVIFSPKMGVYRLYVVGGATFGTTGGGGAVMVVEPKGSVLLKEVVTLTALTLSTYIVEPSMLGMGLMAVARWCQKHIIQLQYVALCSYNLATVQDVQGGPPQERPGLLWTALCVTSTCRAYVCARYGCRLSMTRKKDWSSKLNKAVDMGAEVEGKGGEP